MAMSPGVYQVFDPTYQNVFINQSIYNPHYAGTNITVWVLIAAAAILFTFAAFWVKMRNEEGEINPTKLAFCLLGTLFCGFASWFSIELVIPLGTSTAIYLNQTVSIAQSTIVEGGPLPFLFVVCGIFCFIMGIYINIQPQMVKPEAREFEGPVQAKVRAEGSARGGRRNRGIAEDDVGDDD
jgi:small-conductance mechanosensitive channel